MRIELKPDSHPSGLKTTPVERSGDGSTIPDKIADAAMKREMTNGDSLAGRFGTSALAR
jgi:hypothetical protein